MRERQIYVNEQVKPMPEILSHMMEALQTMLCCVKTCPELIKKLIVYTLYAKKFKNCKCY